MGKKAKPKFYGVRVGRTPGIYGTWAECEAQVKGFAGAKFKGFVVEQEAREFINAASDSPPHPTKKRKTEAAAHAIPARGLALYFDGG